MSKQFVARAVGGVMPGLASLAFRLTLPLCLTFLSHPGHGRSAQGPDRLLSGRALGAERGPIMSSCSVFVLQGHSLLPLHQWKVQVISATPATAAASTARASFRHPDRKAVISVVVRGMEGLGGEERKKIERRLRERLLSRRVVASELLREKRLPQLPVVCEAERVALEGRGELGKVRSRTDRLRAAS